jgi:hypothetical protein
MDSCIVQLAEGSFNFLAHCTCFVLLLLFMLLMGSRSAYFSDERCICSFKNDVLPSGFSILSLNFFTALIMEMFAACWLEIKWTMWHTTLPLSIFLSYFSVGMSSQAAAPSRCWIIPRRHHDFPVVMRPIIIDAIDAGPHRATTGTNYHNKVGHLKSLD